MERSATSIGANIHEAITHTEKLILLQKIANFAQRVLEAECWIELFVKSNLIDKEIEKELYSQCGTIRRILIASINTAKENN